MNQEFSAAQDEESGGGFLNHLPAILWQRRMLILVPFLLLSLLGLAAAFLLPTTYRSSATLLVESQELPQDLVGSPVTALIDQRIAKIRQQVLSRGDLIELIQQNNLYEDERQSEPLSEIVEQMRKDTTIEAVSADIGQQSGNTNTIAFAMNFDYEDAIKAQLVMQSYVERFLEIDASQMAEQATNTVSFLNDQAAGLQQQIATLEGQITSIKAQNGVVLSSAGMSTISNPGSYDAQIAALQRENSLLTQQAQAQKVAKDPVIANAEANLAAAKAIYTDDHPDVRAAEQQLEAAKSVAAGRGSSTDTSAMAATAISANNAQIAALGRARSMEASRSTSSMAAQARAPVVMEQIAQLEARATALRSQFQEVSARLLSARSSAKMESEQKGERLSVVDPPVIPEEPEFPNRPLFIIGGILGGLALGFGLALLFEMMMRPIRGVSEVERMLGVPPLVVIPTIPTKGKGARAGQGLLGRLRSLFSFRRPRAAE